MNKKVKLQLYDFYVILVIVSLSKSLIDPMIKQRKILSSPVVKPLVTTHSSSTSQFETERVTNE